MLIYMESFGSQFYQKNSLPCEGDGFVKSPLKSGSCLFVLLYNIRLLLGQ